MVKQPRDIASEEPTWQFGMACIEHIKKDEVEKMLMVEYPADKFIISLEIASDGKHLATKGEHMHFVLYIKPTHFKNFRETLINRYKLTGKNTKKEMRAYGWLKDIKDPERLKAYSVKDKNIIWHGFENDEIKNYVDQSFTKKENNFEVLMNEMKYHQIEYDVESMDKCCIVNIEKYIIKFYMDRNERCCKSKVKNYTLAYMQLHMKDRYELLDRIYHYTMFN